MDGVGKRISVNHVHVSSSSISDYRKHKKQNLHNWLAANEMVYYELLSIRWCRNWTTIRSAQLSAAAPKTQLLNFDKNRIFIFCHHFGAEPIRFCLRNFLFIDTLYRESCPQVRKISRNFHSCINACDWSLILWKNTRRKKRREHTHRHISIKQKIGIVKLMPLSRSMSIRAVGLRNICVPCFFVGASLSIHFTCLAICIVPAMPLRPIHIQFYRVAHFIICWAGSGSVRHIIRRRYLLYCHFRFHRTWMCVLCVLPFPFGWRLTILFNWTEYKPDRFSFFLFIFCFAVRWLHVVILPRRLCFMSPNGAGCYDCLRAVLFETSRQSKFSYL